MDNFLKINKKINSVVKYEAGLSKLADKKKIIKLSSNENSFGASFKVKKILSKGELPLKMDMSLKKISKYSK